LYHPPHFYMGSNGQIGVGGDFFTTDASFHIQGIDSGSSNYALKVDNLASTPLLYVRNNGLITISGSLQVTGSISGSFTGSLQGTSSYALTASFALNGGGGTIDTGSLLTTSSFNQFTSSYNTGSFTGSFIGNFTGSLFGTSSYALDYPQPIFYYYADTALNTPGDNGVFYSGTLNNYAAETSTTYRFVSPKDNCRFKVYMAVFVRGTLGSAEPTAVSLLNLTQTTSESLGTITSDKRTNHSILSMSALPNNIGDEMIIRGTNPAWETNPTTVHYAWAILGY